MATARSNFSPGQYRDLDKPLVEVDPDASKIARGIDRGTNILSWMMIAGSVGFAALLALGGLIYLITQL